MPALPGHNRSGAADVNDGGVAVGISRHLDNKKSIDIIRAVVWQHGIVRDLYELIQYKTQFEIYRATAVADNGTIVAFAGVLGIKGTVAFVLAPQYTLGDITGDCDVDVDDLINIINEWGDNDSPADLDGSGTVDFADLTIVLDSWSDAT